MECKGSWENVCRKDTCSWTENIPAFGLKGFLQRCRKGTCFCRKNMCSWTEGIPARGRIPAQVQMRISANVQKGFLWKNWRYTCKLAERISVVVHVYIHNVYLWRNQRYTCKLTVRISVKVHVYLQKGHLCPEESTVYLQTDWKDFHTKRISKEELFLYA